MRAVDHVNKALRMLRTGDDLAKSVTQAQLRQKLRDGEWEVSTDIEPAIKERRAIEVRDIETGKKMWVRTSDARDASEWYIVQLKVKGESEKQGNEITNQYRVMASSKSDAETKAKTRAKEYGLDFIRTLSVREEAGAGYGS